VARDFPGFLIQQTPFNSLEDGMKYDCEQIKAALTTAFLDFDKKMKSVADIATSGCTATGVLIAPNHFFFMNIGDSRSVLCSGGRVKFATSDHKPTNPEERQRIEEAGGHVSQGRVNGQLAVSRALGDFELKHRDDLDSTKQLVSPEPVLDVIERNQSDDNFIAICCDGIFDVMSNDDLIDLVSKRIPYHRNLSTLCENVADFCCHKGSKDNLSVVLINFNDSTIQLDDEKATKDEQLDAEIWAKTEEYVHEKFKDGNNAYQWEACFQYMATEHESLFANFDTTNGFGLALKKGVIYNKFDQLVTQYREKRRQEARERQQQAAMQQQQQ